MFNIFQICHFFDVCTSNLHAFYCIFLNKFAFYSGSCCAKLAANYLMLENENPLAHFLEKFYVPAPSMQVRYVQYLWLLPVWCLECLVLSGLRAFECTCRYGFCTSCVGSSSRSTSCRTASSFSAASSPIFDYCACRLFFSRAVLCFWQSSIHTILCSLCSSFPPPPLPLPLHYSQFLILMYIYIYI